MYLQKFSRREFENDVTIVKNLIKDDTTLDKSVADYEFTTDTFLLEFDKNGKVEYVYLSDTLSAEPNFIIKLHYSTNKYCSEVIKSLPNNMYGINFYFFILKQTQMQFIKKLFAHWGELNPFLEAQPSSCYTPECKNFAFFSKLQKTLDRLLTCNLNSDNIFEQWHIRFLTVSYVAYGIEKPNGDKLFINDLTEEIVKFAMDDLKNFESSQLYKRIKEFCFNQVLESALDQLGYLLSLSEGKRKTLINNYQILVSKRGSAVVLGTKEKNSVATELISVLQSESHLYSQHDIFSLLWCDQTTVQWFDNDTNALIQDLKFDFIDTCYVYKVVPQSSTAKDNVIQFLVFDRDSQIVEYSAIGDYSKLTEEDFNNAENAMQQHKTLPEVDECFRQVRQNRKTGMKFF